MIEVMSEPIEILGLYLHLAGASQRRQRPHVRDRMLLISAMIAARMDLPRISAYCRREILIHNPRHLIGRWQRVEEAIDHPDFLHLLKSVQRRYPQERAERLLANLGIERGRERDAYYSDEEYAAALLGSTPDELEQMFGHSA
jgi:hypothetical protein